MNGLCTIVTEDFIPAAFALAESIGKFNANAPLSILVLKESLEEDGARVPEELRGSIVLHSLSDILGAPLAIDMIRRHWNNMNAIRWTLKAVYMSFLLKESLSKVLYVDPDIMFVGDFSFLFEDLDKHGILLTPHWRGMSFKEDDGNFHKQFTEGIFNAGFVGASRSGLPALAWWARLCLERCEKNPALGLYDDQGYLDIMHVYFENVGVVRHRGCNIAIWNRNACARSLDPQGKLVINKKWPAVFLHLSCLGDCPLQVCDPLIIPFVKAYQGALAHYGFKGPTLFFSKHEQARSQLQTLIFELASKGAKSVALYGCGSFTRGIFSERFKTSVPIACIADDNPAIHGKKLLGVPIMSLEKAASRKPDAVIISSDSIADILLEKARKAFDAKKVLALREPPKRKTTSTNLFDTLSLDGPILNFGCLPASDGMKAIKVAWSKGRGSEKDFWNMVLTGAVTQAQKLDETKVMPQIAKAYWATATKNEEPAKTLRVLDLGSGPISKFGAKWPGVQFVLTCVDPLAEDYCKMLDANCPEVKARPITGYGERLLPQFGRRSFDIVFSMNALDHSYNPMLAIRNMAALIKDDGMVYFVVLENEGDFWRYAGMHQWNFAMLRGELIIWSLACNAISVQKELDGFRMEAKVVPGKVYGEGRNFIHVTIRRKG